MDTYIIQKGDTIESVAEKYNIPAIDIIKVNSLIPPYILKVNNVLNIPTAPTSIFNYYKVRKGDTLYKLATISNSSVDVIAAINGLNKEEYLYEGQVILLPKENVSVYITKQGDSISSISSLLKTTPQNLLYNNRNIYVQPDQLIVYKRT